MEKPGFFLWYFTLGLKGFFQIWKNLLVFIAHFFNIRKLSLTLFSSWKKDMIPRNWQGWHPILSLQVAVVNFVFRIYGAMARSVVIITGLALEVAMIAVGIALLVCYLAWPFVFVFSLSLTVHGNPVGAALLVFSVWYAFIILLCFVVDRRVAFNELPIEQLAKKQMFERVYARLGVPSGSVGMETFSSETKLQKLLSSVNVSKQEFSHIVGWETYAYEKKRAKSRFWDMANLLNHGPIGRHWKYGYTSLLNRYALDLSSHDGSTYADQALLHHQKSLEMMQLVLEKNNQNSAILVGEPGAGKRGLIHFLAKLIRTNKLKSQFLIDKRIMLLDLGNALSSAASKGKVLADFAHHLFHEAAGAGNVILVIEGIERYLGQKEDEFHVDISPILEEYLPHPNFQIIATTTSGIYHQLIERNKNIMQHFDLIEVPPVNEQQTMEVILEEYESAEVDHVIFTYAGLRDLIKRSAQLSSATVLPGRALDLVEEVLLHWKNSPSQFVTAELVDEFFSIKTGIPVGKVGADEKDLLLNMEQVLHQRVVGQEEAIKQLAQAVRKVRSGIGNSKKPAASFLFLGPTGVGKTEASKALAEAYFGDEQRMLRFDMSEFQGDSAIDWLIGSTQTNQPGRLTSHAKDHPFSLLLLDEIEKASPNVLDLFLQVLDEGFVTDAFGERVNFRNMIIVATSNAGANLIKDAITQNQDAKVIQKNLIDHVVKQGIFRLEFLNRFDGVIFFRPLKDEELIQVVRLMFDGLAKRIQEEKNISVSFEDSIIPIVIEKGYDPIFGARSLNRYISDSIEDSIAEKIIAQSLNEGGALTITAEDFMEKSAK